MGVELDSGGGDNSGSHSGVRYFICKPGHGYSYLPPKVKRPAEKIRTFGKKMCSNCVVARLTHTALSLTSSPDSLLQQYIAATSSGPLPTVAQLLIPLTFQLTPPSPPPPLIPRLPSTNEDSTPPIPQSQYIHTCSRGQNRKLIST